MTEDAVEHNLESEHYMYTCCEYSRRGCVPSSRREEKGYNRRQSTVPAFLSPTQASYFLFVTRSLLRFVFIRKALFHTVNSSMRK